MGVTCVLSALQILMDRYLKSSLQSLVLAEVVISDRRCPEAWGSIDGGDIPLQRAPSASAIRCTLGAVVSLKVLGLHGGADEHGNPLPSFIQGQLNPSDLEPCPSSQQHIIETSSRGSERSPVATAIPQAHPLGKFDLVPRPIPSPSAAQPNRTRRNKPHTPRARSSSTASPPPPSPTPQQERPSCERLRRA